MKSSLFWKRFNLISLGLVVLFYGCGPAGREMRGIPPESVKLDVVYPRLEGGDSVLVMPVVDSTFAFGSVQPTHSIVWVNGVRAQIWDNGAFLAYSPLDTATMAFNFIAISPEGGRVDASIPFVLPTRMPPSVTVNPPQPVDTLLPARIIIDQDYTVVRNGPDLAYMLFPLSGSVALADSFVNPYYRIRLCTGLHAWVEDRFVSLDTTRRDPPGSLVSRIQVKAGDPWTLIEIPLTEPLLFSLYEQPEIRSIVLELYGARSRINRIDYHPGDSLIREIRWSQLHDDLLRLEIFLNPPLNWGYGAYRDDSKLVLKVRKPPAIARRVLKGRIIALDAGHGGNQTGSIGPTRLAEKEVNLKLAMRLKELLEKEGSRVVLTRWSDSAVGLYERAEYAADQNAEILLSLHNNALSDGENPFVKRGSAVYYYNPMSRDLAWTIHRHLLKATGLKDHGLYYQNLAVVRPTEMPSVLIESAFLMHPEEELLLRDDRFLDRVARGITAGVKDYLRSCRKLQ